MYRTELNKLSNLYSSDIVEQLRKAQNRYQQTKRFGPTRILVELGKSDFANVSSLFECVLQSGSLNLKAAAIFELIKLAQKHPQAIISLVNKALNTDSNLNSNYLLATLFERDPCAIIPFLEQALQSNDPEIQWLTTLEIIELSTKCPDKIIPLLEQALEICEPRIQWVTSLKLFELLKTNPQQIISILKRKFISSSTNENTFVANTLVQMGKKNFDAIKPLLRQALNSNDFELEWAVILSLIDLVHISPREVISLLGQAMHSKYPDILWLVNIQLVQLNKLYPHLISPLFIKAYQHTDNNQENDVNPSSFLYKLRKQDPSSLFLLYEKILFADDLSLKFLALLELITFIQDKPQHVNHILKKFWRTSEEVKMLISSRILVELGSTDPEKVIPYFEQALQSNNPLLQQATALELFAVMKNQPHKLFSILEQYRQEK